MQQRRLGQVEFIEITDFVKNEKKMNSLLKCFVISCLLEDHSFLTECTISSLQD